jgi:hypothetical protein
MTPIVNPADDHVATVGIVAVLNEMVTVQLEFDSDRL